tara:strand:+ start:116 stop:514 length:399 start_codon:yes stop_codon:yes gene_type:complete
MEQHEIMNELTNGICEVIYTDPHSVEHMISATLSPNHLPNANDENNSTENVIHLWNLCDEQWTHIPITDIITITRLTGKDIKNDSINESKNDNNNSDNLDDGLFNMFEQQLLNENDTAGESNMGSGDKQQSR